MKDLILLSALSIPCLVLSDCKPAALYMTIIILIVLLCTQQHQVQTRQFSNISASKAQLKRTKNPRFVPDTSTQEPESKPTVKESTPPIEPVYSNYNISDYTPDGMNDKMEKRIFSRELHHSQSATSRTRLLNSLYEDLMNESVKDDPYLRINGETGCKSMKGRRMQVKNDDC